MVALAASRRHARGQVTVEVAVAFPLLIVVALALIQFVIVVHAHNVVEAAVQDGARVAASETGSDSDALQRARELLDAGPSQLQNIRFDFAGSDPDVVVMNAHGSVSTILPWFDPSHGGLTHLSIRMDVSARVSHEHFRPMPPVGGGG